MRHQGYVVVLGQRVMRLRWELDMEQLEVPAKFGYFWTITGDVQFVRRAGYSTGRWRIGCVGTRWGVTKERDNTGLVGKGCWVHYDRYKIKKG